MAFLLRRIHCHFCGSRSPHTRSSGIPEFLCATCEAVNFLDSKGDITDTPASIAAQSQQRAPEARPAFKTFTHDLPESLYHQQNTAFCETCIKNQQIYLQTLSSYLPDEDHPEYQKYEDGLPRFTQDLGERYPQICAKCAPRAQNKIHQADYYAGTQNVAMLGSKTRARRGASARGMRDDWGKWSMRQGLDFVGWMCYASLLAQIAWHIYGMFIAVSNPDIAATDFAFDATPQTCISSALGLQFDQTCHQLLGDYMARALFMSACLLWYNTGLKDWFHHTHRMEAVTGQTEYLQIQLVMLAVRAVAYYKLSDSAITATFTTQQLLAVHGFMVVFIALIQCISERAIKSIIFKLKLNMMPRPEERDVLGTLAGPVRESLTPHASLLSPKQLFARDRIAPFPIANLAHKQNTQNPHSQSAIPSPPLSDDTDDESDVEDMDWQPTVQSKMPGAKIDRTYRARATPTKLMQQPARSMYNSGGTQSSGWSGMRDSLFGVQDNLQVENERKRREEEERAKLRYDPLKPNPFRGTLPQAPMSMGKRLRNPVMQASFKQTPVTKQRDFMVQMRGGIGDGKTFAKQPEEEITQKKLVRFPNSNDPDDVAFTPAKLRTRGNLELKKSEWTLASDMPAATGLEDLFGGSTFRIADEPALAFAADEQRRTQENSKMMKVGLAVAVPVLVVVALWNVRPVRRWLCLWIVDRLDGMGL
ncbi:hypothetical protein LTR08_006815 [Meristemomyces frigidus]|nr:hypothetical protein LTR08_006815 [Meristemomyces frigidus]